MCRKLFFWYLESLHCYFVAARLLQTYDCLKTVVYTAKVNINMYGIKTERNERPQRVTPRHHSIMKRTVFCFLSVFVFCRKGEICVSQKATKLSVETFKASLRSVWSKILQTSTKTLFKPVFDLRKNL